mgnify:CR=1 FL=1
MCPNSEKTGQNRARRIREARRQAGMTQEDLAEACGVTASAVAQWESARSETRTAPSTAHLLSISQATGRPVDWLSGFAPTPATIAIEALAGAVPRLPAQPVDAGSPIGVEVDTYAAIAEAVASRFPGAAGEIQHRIAIEIYRTVAGR